MAGVRRYRLVILTALVACGPTAPSGSGEATSSASTTAAASTAFVTTAGSSTGLTGSTSTTGSNGSTGQTDAGTTFASDASTSTGEVDAGSTGTGEPVEPFYRVYVYIGGYDRLIIRKADPGAGRCTSIKLVHGGKAGGEELDPPAVIDVVLPPEFAVEAVAITPNWEDCEESGVGFEFVASSVVGVVALHGQSQARSGSVDIDVTLTMVQDEPWKPAQEHLLAVGLPLP